MVEGYKLNNGRHINNRNINSGFDIVGSTNSGINLAKISYFFALISDKSLSSGMKERFA